MIHDLSLEHHPIGSLFPDVNHQTLTGYELDPTQIDFFHEYGYLRGVRILSDEQLGTLTQELAAGLVSMIRTAKTDACITSLAAITGRICPSPD